MKEIILLSALALVHGGAIDYNVNGCPRDNAIEKLLPHENCHQFYQCLNGILVTRICPAGLYFDSEREVCDWPQNTNCRDQHQNEVNSDPENTENLNAGDPSQAPKICATPESNGVLVAHEICNKFYKCSYGNPVALNCPLNLLYNPGNLQCDWPGKVDCGNRVISENDNIGNDNDGNGNDGTVDVDIDKNDDVTINDDPSEAPSICKAEGSDSVLVAHENCNQFYKCSQGLPVTLKCPLNLLYNPPKEYCDWPVNVDCGSRTILENEDIDTNVEENKLTRHVRDVESTINSDPSKAPSICAAKDSDGILVAHENCNEFYKCLHSVPVSLICPTSLLYNPEKEHCDWTENVDCGNRLIPETDAVYDDSESNNNHGNGVEDVANNEVAENENADPSEASAICAAEDSDGELIAHENCNQYYKCSEGRPIALSCPLNLLYNPSKKYCDWPQEVDCGNRVIPEPDDDNASDGGNGEENGGNSEDDKEINDNPSKAPEICAAEGSDGVLIAHELCNKFYKCSEGLPFALPCPGNLLYNPSKQYCDWPQDVDCGNRVIPEPEDDNTGDGGNGQEDGGHCEDDKEVNDDPSEAPKICAAEGSDGVLIAHELCNKFYKCSEGLPVALQCPGNLLYNPSKKYCDWPENVKCGDRSLSLEEENVDKNEEKETDAIQEVEIDYAVKAAAICADMNSNPVLAPHENCDQFYKCAFGVPVAVSCPSGLLYNPRVEVCDWPVNVDCDSRNRRIQTVKTYLEAKKPLKFLLRVY